MEPEVHGHKINIQVYDCWIGGSAAQDNRRGHKERSKVQMERSFLRCSNRLHPYRRLVCKCHTITASKEPRATIDNQELDVICVDIIGTFRSRNNMNSARNTWVGLGILRYHSELEKAIIDDANTRDGMNLPWNTCGAQLDDLVCGCQLASTNMGAYGPNLLPTMWPNLPQQNDIDGMNFTHNLSNVTSDVTIMVAAASR